MQLLLLRKDPVLLFHSDRRRETPLSCKRLQESPDRFIMDKDYLNILVFGCSTFGITRLRIRRETFKTLVYLLAFFQLSIMFFLCDYVQVKKRELHVNQLRQESQIQKDQIQLFSTKIREVEKRLSRLKDIDGRIRAIANLEKNQEITPFIGMGGSPSSAILQKVKEKKEGR